MYIYIVIHTKPICHSYSATILEPLGMTPQIRIQSPSVHMKNTRPWFPMVPKPM